MGIFTHSIVDVIAALLAALFELATWVFVSGWFFIAVAALFLLSALRGKLRRSRGVLVAVVLLFAGLGLMWWSGGNAFRPPVARFINLLNYVHRG